MESKLLTRPFRYYIKKHKGLITLGIITLFLTALMKWESALAVSLLFICCLVSLIISLIAFIMDIRLSLQALKMEMGQDDHAGTAT